MMHWLPYLVFSLLSGWITFVLALALNRWMPRAGRVWRAGLAAASALLPCLIITLVVVWRSGGAVLLSMSSDEFLVPFIMQNCLTLAVAVPLGWVMARTGAGAKWPGEGELRP